MEEKETVRKFFQKAHKLWCHPVSDPRLGTTIHDISDAINLDSLVDQVASSLESQGIKNLLGSTRENLKVLIPIILEKMEK